MRFEAFGVVVDVEVPPAIPTSAVEALLPPGNVPSAALDAAGHVAIREAGADVFDVVLGDRPVAFAVRSDVALAVLESQIRVVIGVHAPDRVFIHAGAVGMDGRVIVAPGYSFAGKTALVEALLRAGATYFSDEFAVLDDAGLVWPYPKPLSLRTRPDAGQPASRLASPTAADSLGATTADRPAPIGVIAALRYSAEREWAVKERSRAQGALMLMSHALAGRTAPGRVLPIVRKAAEAAQALEGIRGDADEAAERLLAMLADRP